MEKCPIDVAYDQPKFDQYWTERLPENAPPSRKPQSVRRGVNNDKPLSEEAFLRVEYRSKTNGVTGRTTYDNLHAPQLDGPTSGTGGVIIAANNDQREDKAAPEDRLRFSEILF